MISLKRTGVLVAIIISFIITPASAIPDPSAVYCGQLGYEFTIIRTGTGEVGLCRFPDGSVVDAWAFLKGDAGQDHNYCKEKGYGFKVVENDSRCPGMYFGKCVLCISPGGKETEVTELMKQDGKYPDYEGWTLLSCNHNQICEPEEGENYAECPEDCPSGGKDDYCDKKQDNICDPDCSKEQDIDCRSTKSEKPGKTNSIYYIILAIILAVLAALVLYRKTWQKKKWKELETKYTKKQ